MKERGEEVSCGVAESAICAYAAAVDGSTEEVVRFVEPGGGRAFLRERPIDVLNPEKRLRLILEGVGIETCGELAALEREAVEVRLGAEALEIWRLSRGEDDRQLFRLPSTDRPQASLDFIDYVVTDPERLAFTANTLLGGICETLAERGSHARRVMLTLSLANGETWRKVLRPARPTGSRPVWLRLVRRVLERLSVPDAVSGLSLEVVDVEAASTIQGDLFDLGFATAGAVEAALSRLLETQGPVVVRAESNAHPLAEQRTEYIGLDAEMVAVWSGTRVELTSKSGPLGLTLQLLPNPRAITVETLPRRDHAVPTRYRDGEWKRFVSVTGPERIAGGEWAEPYAREYFRGITIEGLLVWIFHDLIEDRWYLHGHWD
jgi:hypothetical protein